METVSNICMWCAVIAALVTIVLVVVWLVMVIRKKGGRRKTGRAVLAVLASFIVLTVVGVATSPMSSCEHDYRLTSSTDATCEESGSNEYKCGLCGMERTEKIESLGHDMVDGVCSRCGHEEDVESEVAPTYGRAVKQFARKNKVSEAFAQSIKDVLDTTNYAERYSDLWLDSLDDWARGKRYRAWGGSGDDHIAFMVYELNDLVESFYDICDGTKALIYQAGNGTPEEVEQPGNGGVRIIDGILGEYGENVTIHSGTSGEHTYTWYKVPYGTYDVQNELKSATVFVVDDSNSENVASVIRFSETGEVQRVTISEGFHIEVSMGTEILLMPIG